MGLKNYKKILFIEQFSALSEHVKQVKTSRMLVKSEN